MITNGAYALLRHPSYTAAIMVNLGVALALGSWLAVIIMLVASIVVYGYRISVEERALRTTIGEPYELFMSGRKQLVRLHLLGTYQQHAFNPRVDWIRRVPGAGITHRVEREPRR